MSVFETVKRKIGMQKPVKEDDIPLEELEKLFTERPVPDDKQGVNRIELKSDGDVDVVIESVAKDNIVVVDMSPLLRNKETLKKMVHRLQASANRMKWQICRISNELLLVVPGNIQVNAA